MRVVITGASGAIGRVLVAAWRHHHSVTSIDLAGGSGVIAADLAERNPVLVGLRRLGWTPRWEKSFAGADAVVHLAANANPNAHWRSAVLDNCGSTCNVLRAARAAGVPRVVFASSLHAVLGRIGGDPDGSDTTGQALLDANAEHFPLTYYGASKAFGEDLGRAFVTRGWLRAFVAVRVGYYHPRDPEKEVWRTHRIAADDLVRSFSRALERPNSGFRVVYTARAGTPAPPDPVGTA